MPRLIALFLLILTSPLLAALFIIVKLTSKGPFVFRQKRIGKDLKPFTIYKIRTMVKEAESIKAEIRHLNEIDGPVFKIKDDPRYTKIGKLIAYYGLDEILQLVNIIKGEMNFVGPRPLPIDEAKQIPQKYQDRFKIKPGITSLWIVQGAHNLTFAQWMESDLEYLKRKNWQLDLYIIVLTLLSIIRWNTQALFLTFFPLILLYYAVFPDFIWWNQILIFFSIFIFLGLDSKRKPSLLLILLLLILGLSTFFSINKISSVPYFFSYLVVFILYSYFQQENKDTLLRGFVFGTLFIGLLSTIHSLIRTIDIPLPSFLTFLDNQFNLVVPYFGHAFYVIFLIAVIPFIMEKTFQEKISFCWLSVFFLANLFLLFTFSKAGILIAGMEIFFFLILNRKIKPKLKLFTGSICILLFLLILAGIVAKSNNPFLNEKIVKPSIPSRIEYLHQNYQIIKNSSCERLLVGYGPDTFYELSNRYQSQINYWSRSAHNFFIQFAIENGFFTTLIFIIFLARSIYKNLPRYLLFEKITVFSLLVYSLVGTYSLNSFPVFLLFLLLVKKDKTEKEKSDFSYSKLLLPVFILILIFYWGRYLYAYIKIFVFDRQSDLKIIHTFPYETYFWNALIRNSDNNPSFIKEIQNQLSRYSKSNLDLEKNIITKVFETENYCLALSAATNIIERSPFDLEIQKILMESYSKCGDKRYKDLGRFLGRIKNVYPDMTSRSLFPLRYFFQFISLYYYHQKEMDKYQDWFGKTWLLQEKNETDNWKEELFYQDYLPIPIKGPIRIQLSLEGEGGLSGIGLYGKLPPKGSSWSKAVKLFAGVNENNKAVYISLNDENSDSPVTVLDKNRSEGLTMEIIDLYFDEKGRNLTITDEKGTQIKKINFPDLTKNTITEGIFPEGKIHLSYGVASQSSLMIKKIMIMPIE